VPSAKRAEALVVDADQALVLPMVAARQYVARLLVDQVTEFVVLLLEAEVLPQRLAGIRYIGCQGNAGALDLATAGIAGDMQRSVSARTANTAESAVPIAYSLSCSNLNFSRTLFSVYSVCLKPN
jgi:hypothetical protein